MYKKELESALLAAKEASSIILKYYDQDYEVQDKGGNHPLTIADQESDQKIKEILLSEFPEDGWLSEETADNASRLDKKRAWIVDPLDGTKEFIKKIPEFCVSIALVEDGKPVVGVILNPGVSDIFSASKGQGAFLNESPIQVSSQSDLSSSQILASRSELKRGEWEVFKNQFNVIPSGGMAYKMTQVACGKADASFSLTPKNEWDFAAGDLIIREAGGFVSQINGDDFTYNKKDPLASGIFYSNQNLSQKLLNIAQDHQS